MSEEFRSTQQPSGPRKTEALANTGLQTGGGSSERTPWAADAWPAASLPSPSPVGVELNNLEEDLLIQTAELVEQVLKQLADLSRREQSLNVQLWQLEQDRRAFRLEKQQHDQQVCDDEEQLRLARQEVDAFRDSLEAEKATLSREQAAMAERSSTIDRERAAINEQRERLRQEATKELEQQRATLQESLAKSEAERQEFTQTQQRLVDQETELRETLERERSQLAQQQGRLIEQLESERQAMAEQLESERQQLAEQITTEALTDEIVAERTLLARERESLQESIEDWQQQKLDAEAELKRRQNRLDEEHLRFQQEIDDLRRRTWEEIEQEQIEQQRRVQS